MPLSDHEQKMLEQMEQALAAEDPKFASQMQGSSSASLQRRRWLVGGRRGARGSGSRARRRQHDDVGRGHRLRRHGRLRGLRRDPAAQVPAGRRARRTAPPTPTPRVAARRASAPSWTGSTSAGSAARTTGDDPRASRQDATSPATYRHAMTSPAASSMPMLCSTATRACLVRTHACDRSRRAPHLDDEDAEDEADDRADHGDDEEPDDPEQHGQGQGRGLHTPLAHAAAGQGVLQDVADDGHEQARDEDPPGQAGALHEGPQQHPCKDERGGRAGRAGRCRRVRRR